MTGQWTPWRDWLLPSQLTWRCRTYLMDLNGIFFKLFLTLQSQSYLEQTSTTGIHFSKSFFPLILVQFETELHSNHWIIMVWASRYVLPLPLRILSMISNSHSYPGEESSRVWQTSRSQLPDSEFWESWPADPIPVHHTAETSLCSIYWTVFCEVHEVGVPTQLWDRN